MVVTGKEMPCRKTSGKTRTCTPHCQGTEVVSESASTFDTVCHLCVQIKEREEHKRREKEDKKRHDAKIKAEMMAYNPWGRSGGGAPIKDKNGNLFSKFADDGAL